MPLYKTCVWWKNFDCIFGFSVKSYVRNTINLSWAKILLSSVISHVRDKVVYCCWVSIYALINYVILFIYFLFLHLAVPLGSVRGTLGYRGTPAGNHWSTGSSGAKTTVLLDCWPWRWRHHNDTKRWEILTWRQGVTSQRTWIFSKFKFHKPDILFTVTDLRSECQRGRKEHS
jgi:hypothetical protein